MAMSTRVTFDDLEVDLSAGHLYRGGVRIPLREQCFRILAALLENDGEPVTRDALRDRLWPGEAYGDFDNGLNHAVAQLRCALGDTAAEPRYIETLPKRGYRFLVPAVAESPSLPSVPDARPRLVVLPFLNLTGDPTQEYLSDGMTEEVITQLAAIASDRLSLIARTTAFCYKNARKDVAQIGKELAVDYLLEGAIRRDHHRLTVSAQLIRASDQTHLFARRYEAALDQVFELRSAIADSVETCLAETEGRIPGPRRRSGERRRRPTHDVVAWKEYIHGRFLFERMTPESIERSRGHLELAIARDPGFALAHDALAELYSILGYLGYLRPKEAFSVGISHALTAVEMDDTLAESHALLGQYHKMLDYNWDAAERAMARAIELDPDSPVVRVRHAMHLLTPHARLPEAIAELDRALESDPLSQLTLTWAGIVRVLSHQYDRAIERAAPLFELDPSSPWAHFLLGVSYREKFAEAQRDGVADPDFAERAIRAHRCAVERAPGTDFFLGWLGFAFGICGEEAEARAVLARLLASKRYNLPSTLGLVYLGLGETDAAFDWFARGVEERDQIMMPVLSYAFFKPFRDDPRFHELVRGLKLAPRPPSVDGTRTG